MCLTVTTEKKVVIDRLASALASEIQLNYLPQEYARCAMTLLPLYQAARAFGPLPEDVEQIMAQVEKALGRYPHYACECCNALFADTDDLEALTEGYIQLLDADQERPAGFCPVCGADVHEVGPVK
jgi:hypothetical protein